MIHVALSLWTAVKTRLLYSAGFLFIVVIIHWSDDIRMESIRWCKYNMAAISLLRPYLDLLQRFAQVVRLDLQRNKSRKPSALPNITPRIIESRICHG